MAYTIGSIDATLVRDIMFFEHRAEPMVRFL